MCTATGSGLHYSIDEAGVWVDCMRERRPVIHNDYPSLPHRKGLPEGHAPVIRELVVPVMRADSIVAVIGIRNKPSDYLAHDIETIASLADLAWDIVEVKRREEKLQRSEAILRSSQHIARLGGWEWDVRKQSMYWTAETYLLHDAEPGRAGSGMDDLIAMSLQCYRPGDRQIVYGAFERCAMDGQPYDMEFAFTTLKGRELWIRTFAEPVIEDGTVTRVVGILMDITERKRSEERLKQSNT
jgi:PAS domain-containing protein